MNEQNLRKPFTKDEAKEYGRRGGLKSAESRKKKKLIRETLEEVLKQKIKDDDMKETMKNLGIKGTPTYQDYLIMMIVTRTAEKGTMADLEKLAELLGETAEQAEPVVLVKAKEILDNVPSVID